MLPLAVPEPLVSITPPGHRVTQTRSGLATQLPPAKYYEGWQAVIGQLFKWWNEPEYFAGEDYDPPTGEILELAMSFAKCFRDAGLVPPHRVVPDADRGVVFEARRGTLAEKIHIWSDGEVEYLLFSGSQLIERRPIPRT